MIKKPKKKSKHASWRAYWNHCQKIYVVTYSDFDEIDGLAIGIGTLVLKKL